MKRTALLAALLVVSCSGPDFRKTADSWEGRRLDLLLEAWGPPASRATLSNGGEVLQYTRGRTVHIPGPLVHQPTTTTIYGGGRTYTAQGTTPVQMSGTTINQWCDIRFVTFPNRQIKAVRWTGNWCWGPEAPERPPPVFQSMPTTK